MIDHLIFDFDGTISDSYPLFVQFIHKIAENRRLPLNFNDVELERALRVSVKKAYDLLDCEALVSYSDFRNEFDRLQEEHAMEFQAIPEAVELLEYSVQQGKKNYLYTHSGKIVHDMLKNMGIDHLFSFILDASYGFPSKPAPDALLFLMEHLSLDPKDCIMIGDRPIDSSAGMNAGMVGCLWDPAHLYPGTVVDHCVLSFSEIKTII